MNQSEVNQREVNFHCCGDIKNISDRKAISSLY